MQSGGSQGAFEIRVLSANAAPNDEEPGTYRVALETTRGPIACLFYPSEGEVGAVVWVGGASGGLGGPASLYAEVARALVPAGVTSVRIAYRQPNVFAECVLDALAAFSFLSAIGAQAVCIVGHSFGGAVAIKAGVLGGALVRGVVAMASQLSGAEDADSLSPRPLLLVHGTRDTVLAPRASEMIYGRAKEPKQLVLYPGAGHGLQECGDELAALLTDWLAGQVGRVALHGAS
ncbi:MAG TPA: alpha/beta hydrolase [Dehalococcoidia bacterium]|nr:alpha/beta hydrolase [Dehalococcoidia bacterium]